MRIFLLKLFIIINACALGENIYPVYREYLAKANVMEVFVYTSDSSGNRILIRHEWITTSGYTSKFLIIGNTNDVPDTASRFATVITSDCDTLGRPVKTRRIIKGEVKPEYTSQYLADGRIIQTYTDNTNGEKWTVINEHIRKQKTDTYTKYENGKVTYQRAYKLKKGYWDFRIRDEIYDRLKTVAIGKEYTDSLNRIIRIEQRSFNMDSDDAELYPEVVIYNRLENGLVKERHVWQKAGDDSTKEVEYYEYVTRP